MFEIKQVTFVFRDLQHQIHILPVIIFSVGSLHTGQTSDKGNSAADTNNGVIKTKNRGFSILDLDCICR